MAALAHYLEERLSVCSAHPTTTLRHCNPLPPGQCHTCLARSGSDQPMLAANRLVCQGRSHQTRHVQGRPQDCPNRFPEYRPATPQAGSWLRLAVGASAPVNLRPTSCVALPPVSGIPRSNTWHRPCAIWAVHPCTTHKPSPGAAFAAVSQSRGLCGCLNCLSRNSSRMSRISGHRISQPKGWWGRLSRTGPKSPAQWPPGLPTKGGRQWVAPSDAPPTCARKGYWPHPRRGSG